MTYKPVAKHRTPTSHWLTEYNKDQWKSEAYNTVVINKSEPCCIPRPSLLEIRLALKYWAMLSQRASFPDEIRAILKGQPVDRKSVLTQLTPQIDDDQVLRICGRLGNTNLPYEVRHPSILSRKSALARLLAEEAHLMLAHGGIQSCTQFLRNKFWIIGIRQLDTAQCCTKLCRLHALSSAN